MTTHDLGPWSEESVTATLGLVLSTTRLLRRLQRHGVPGPAPPAGVPVDRAAEMEAELAGVLASVQPVLDECHQVVERARAEAELMVSRSRAEAALTVAEASERAATVAADEARRESERLEREAELIAESARAEAERIRAVAADRIGPLRERIVGTILALPDREIR